MGLINQQLSPHVIRSAASQLGEDRDRTASAIATSVPSVLTALSDVAASEAGAAHLKEVIDEERRLPLDKHPGGGAAFVPSRAAAGDHAVGFLDDELGTRAARLTDAVARSSGIKRDSAHKLMEGLTAVAVATIAKTAGSVGGGVGGGVDEGALRTMFHEQRAGWMRRLPAPVASLFHGDAVAPAMMAATRTASIVKRVYEAPATGPATNRIERPSRAWLLLLLLVGLAILAIPVLRGLRRPQHAPPTQPAATRSAPPRPRSVRLLIESAVPPPGTTAEMAAFESADIVVTGR